MHPEALRTWVRQGEIDEGDRPGMISEDAARIAELERENRELRRVNLDFSPNWVVSGVGNVKGALPQR